VAILTSDGNGSGGGDICRTAYENQGPADFNPKTWERIHLEWEVDYNQNHDRLPEGEKQTARIIVPAVCGHWAGDRIVTAGDYGEAGKFMSRADEILGMHDKFWAQLEYEKLEYDRKCIGTSNPPTETYLAEMITGGERPLSVLDYNLYSMACERFKDLGPDVKHAIAEYGEGRTSAINLDAKLSDLLSRRLAAEYTHTVLVGKGKRQRRQWRTHWLTLEMLEMLLRTWNDAEDLKRVKAWLRKQQLEPWQREALKCYHGRDRDGNEKINTGQLERVLTEHGIERDPEHTHRYVFPPVLPTDEILEAALAVQAKVAGKAYRAVTIDEVDEGHVERVAEAAGIPMRSRVVDLDGAGS